MENASRLPVQRIRVLTALFCLVDREKGGVGGQLTGDYFSSRLSFCFIFCFQGSSHFPFLSLNMIKTWAIVDS